MSLSVSAGLGLYGKGIFWAAAIGGYGVIVTVLGFILSTDRRDAGIKIMPVFLYLIFFVALFFYLLVSSFNSPSIDQKQSPGTSITI
jgi:vacuolar-type H+-ATPase subunit I/STV1